MFVCHEVAKEAVIGLCNTLNIDCISIIVTVRNQIEFLSLRWNAVCFAVFFIIYSNCYTIYTKSILQCTNCVLAAVAAKRTRKKKRITTKIDWNRLESKLD